MIMIRSNHIENLSVSENAALAPLLGGVRTGANMKLGELEEIVLSENGVRLSPEEILTRLGAPSSLARNATDIMVGIHLFHRNEPFILIRVSAYDRAFEGMLAWEKNMGDSLGAFFAPQNGPTPKLTFFDRVFQNLDVRESQPEWRIQYGFPERNLLLLTTNESTIKEVLTRLSLQSGN